MKKWIAFFTLTILMICTNFAAVKKGYNLIFHSYASSISPASLQGAEQDYAIALSRGSDLAILSEGSSKPLTSCGQ